MVANLFQVYLHDGEGQTILGIGDGTSGQKLCLELINNSDDTIVFDQVDLQKPHFELAFRPGTLFEKNIEKITSSATIFKQSSDPNNKDSLDPQKIDCQKLSNNQPSDNSFSFSYQNNSFFFFCNYKQNNQLIKLAKGEKLLFTLENISAEPAGGSRGTRVELKYQNLTYGTTNNFIIGNQLQYLNIVNQRGSKNLPLYVGFVGSTEVAKDKSITTSQNSTIAIEIIDNKIIYDNSQPNISPNANNQNGNPKKIKSLSVVGSNKVLNDGTENKLILTFRYLNSLQDNPTKSSGNNSNQNSQPQKGLSLLGSKKNTDSATKFRITFDVLEDNAEDSGFRLLRTSNANAVKMKIYDSGLGYLEENASSTQWDIRTDGQGNTRQWIITCNQDALNLTNEILRLEISDLKTNLQAGYANLYVYYENILGYWDGHIICPIEKGPLMLAKDNNNEESVGIGTNVPLAKLHVKQNKKTKDLKDINTKVAYFEGHSGIQVDGATDNYNALWISNNTTTSPALLIEQNGLSNSAHFKGGTGVCINEVTKGNGLYVENNSSSHPTLYVNQKGSAYTASFRGGKGVRIDGVKSNNSIIYHDDSALYIESETLNQPTLSVKQIGSAYTASFRGGQGVCIREVNNYHALDISNKTSDFSTLFVKQQGTSHAAYFAGGQGVCIREVTKGNGLYIESETEDLSTLKVVQKKTTDKSRAAIFQGNVEVTGRISCGGKIGIYSAGNEYLTHRTDKIEAHFGPKTLGTREEFTLAMSCSRELKENIVSISTEEATSTLEHLNPVKYDYKSDRAFRPNIGFIAEEMPDNLASYDKKSLSPFEVTPILTKVVQEQQKTIALLQQRLDDLERSR